MTDRYCSICAARIGDHDMGIHNAHDRQRSDTNPTVLLPDTLNARLTRQNASLHRTIVGLEGDLADALHDAEKWQRTARELGQLHEGET